MTEADLRTFHDSFSRCMGDARFFDHFYDRFLASSPEVTKKFQGTDFWRQKLALKQSLYTIVDAAIRRSVDYSPLRDIAERHSRQHTDIRPDLYDLWLSSLIETVAKCDPRYDASVGETWRNALAPAIEYMTARY